MGRVRMLPPDFFTDEVLATLPPGHRLAFAGLFCEADREGRMRDLPRSLKLYVMPWDEVDFGAMLDELAKAALIVRYERDGGQFIAIPGWFKRWRQKPHIREAKSDIPAPPKTPTTTPPPAAGNDGQASQGMPKASLGSASDQKLDESGVSTGNDPKNPAKARLGQAKDQPRRPDPDPDPDPKSDPDSRSIEPGWPLALLTEIRTSCGKTDTDQEWKAFVSKTSRPEITNAQRLAGARDFLDGGYARTKDDPLSYCAAMIKNSSGTPRASNGKPADSGGRVIPDATETERKMAARRAQPKASPEAIEAAKASLPPGLRSRLKA